jgi:hypothetical protein
MTLSPMEPNVSDIICLGAQIHLGLQVTQEVPQRKVGESLFRSLVKQVGEVLVVRCRVSTAKRIDGHRDSGAVELFGI